MVTIYEMVQNLSVKNFDIMKKICEPLNRYFGINHFSLTKTMSSGQSFCIGSHVAFQEFYYLEKKFIWNPLHIDPKYIKSGVYSYNHMQYSKFQETLGEIKNKMDLNPVLTIYVKENEQSIRFAYCTSVKNDYHQMLMLLNSNINLLNRFNQYFLNEMELLLKNAWENSICLKKEMGDKFSVPECHETPLQLTNHDRLKFLRDIKILSANNEITDREVAYLNLLAQGMTSKQIAHRMNRSIRTVENCIEILKSKFDVKSKADLVGIAQLFE